MDPVGTVNTVADMGSTVGNVGSVDIYSLRGLSRSAPLQENPK